ncbi:MAG: nucleotidyltransferase family protein [Pseudonocardiaceae bacterium]
MQRLPGRGERGVEGGRRGIRRLVLFGSVLRGEDTPASDVDLLVEFEEGRTPGLLG